MSVTFPGGAGDGGCCTTAGATTGAAGGAGDLAAGAAGGTAGGAGDLTAGVRDCCLLRGALEAACELCSRGESFTRRLG